MNHHEAIAILKNEITCTLTDLIPGDYCLLDAPYYHNIGDVLIWQGIHDFCRTLRGRDLGTSDLTTCLFPKLPNDTTILLMGGGNFGDLWRIFQNFRLKVIRHYPDNRIIMLPQSVWYENDGLISSDYAAFRQHRDLYLCARDLPSYEFLNKHFPECHILMLPDMAFCINPDVLMPYKHRQCGRKLFLKRLDKELVDETSSPLPEDEYEIRDWPTYEKTDKLLWLTKRLTGLHYRTKNIPLLGRISANITNNAAQFTIRKHLVNLGLKFMSPYSEIITTRLHTLILAALLEKPVRYIDNSTGKLSAFAHTWLDEFENVKPFNQ